MSVRRASGTTLYTNATTLSPWKFRQILAWGYVAGGYKNSVPWRNVNKLNMSADITTSYGDLLQAQANYTAGLHNRDNAFMFGTGGTSTITAYTSVFNMRNDTTYAHNAAMNTPQNIGDCATVQQENARGWIFNSATNPTGSGGPGYNILRFDLVTQTASSSVIGAIASINEGGGSHYNETTGYVWGSGKIRFSFATESQTSGGDYAAHGQQKGQPTKDNYGYGGNQGSYNGGYQFRKWNQVTESQQSITTKPIGNSGEENFCLGQDHGWMLGMYDGAQNNRAWRYTFSTDTGFEGNGSMQPSASGIAGRSSGHCFWRD